MAGKTSSGESAGNVANSAELTRQHALRIVDANANRAAEGLRTIEDFARLAKEDENCARWMKELRHSLSTALIGLDRRQLLSSRCTETDAGTENTTEKELERTDLSGLVPAAAQRVSQALRCLEEATKVLSTEISLRVKQLRYEAYDVLAKTELKLSTQRLKFDMQLYLLIDCRLPIDHFAGYVSDLAAAGVDIFQLRDKRAEGAELMCYARLARKALSGSDAMLVINDRVDVAMACKADGVHIGQEDMPIQDARRLVGHSMWIGISTHDVEQALAAEQAGADYIGCGPTFASQTKNFDTFAGPAFLRETAKQVPLPMFAIGGISAANLPQVLETGCRRIAVSNAIHGATEPAKAAAELRHALSQAGTSDIAS